MIGFELCTGEEKGLVAGAVIDLRNKDRPSKGEAKDIEVQRRDGRGNA